MIDAEQLKPKVILQGPVYPEPVQVLVVSPIGDRVQVIATGLQSNQTYNQILSPDHLAVLEVAPEHETFDGDPAMFRLGVEAMRLGLAYEYDPYFSLSVARVDPLPHQLEAVYDYFLKLPRIRFLLADDPGAGKTIMAGLLLKELKIRGLARRVLVVCPANLTFQWQREMQDKFRENFEVLRGENLRANYGFNPWLERDQVITSLSWVSRVEDARDSLMSANWDLVIVDEAHKMSAYGRGRETLAYKLGRELGDRTDHYLLMTATPHKGDPQNFCLFLELLDRDVYGDVKSLEEAMQRNSAPFYLRRTKEALVTFPDPDTGEIRRIFTKRDVQTTEFRIDEDEIEFYDALTRYVEDQSFKAQSDLSPRGRALQFTMAMLQRRFASSVYAARRSLERMRDKRQRILDDPEGFRREQISRNVPDDFDELPEDEQQEILEHLEEVVASYDPADLEAEITQLTRLIRDAMVLEEREIETKLRKLREVITEHGVFDDPKMKLLIFTEHKDTLDYLVAKLQNWGLKVTQIHGGMKIGNRDEPGTRLHAERAFRDESQILVATEAAGEGINLQFCWFMINYDIPWNPVRLEQRMGRIHRYGQEKDCLVLNFVSTNTREGRVLQRLFDRIHAIEVDLDPHRTGQVFNVLGDIFPANQLEKMLRDMYARNLTEDAIKSRIVRDVDIRHFRAITQSTLEGLAKRELNLAAIVGKSAEARARRLVPEIVEKFFMEAGPKAGVQPREDRRHPHVYRIGSMPSDLRRIGEQQQAKFGRLGRDYRQIVFDKSLLQADATSEWVTPGHPLFEAVRRYVVERSTDDLRRGAVFFDLQVEAPYHLDIFTAAVKDGLGKHLHRGIYVVQSDGDGGTAVRHPTLFLDLIPAPDHDGPLDPSRPSVPELERTLIEQSLNPLLGQLQQERAREVHTIEQHIQISLQELIHRQTLRWSELTAQQQRGDESPLVAANLQQIGDRLTELNARLETRLADLRREQQCSISDIQRVGRAWVLPHPERSTRFSHMVSDAEIERVAVERAIAYEVARGYDVISVERENKGYDLESRKFHPTEPDTVIDVRFIEVKGRAGVGSVALTENEYRTAQVTSDEYWLYVVYNCASEPELHLIRNPATLDWEPIVQVLHYHIASTPLLAAESGE